MSSEIIEIKKKVDSAVQTLLDNDIDLLKLQVHERTVCHKFAEYLQSEFSCWNVDMEYNRKGKSPKFLKDLDGCKEHRNEKNLVIPDIIIHHRNTNENLLVIEMKTSNRNPQCDIAKLKKFTSADTDDPYTFGLFIKFNQINEERKSIKKPNCIWFEKGKITSQIPLDT